MRSFFSVSLVFLRITAELIQWIGSSLRQLFGDQMSYPGRLRAEIKRLGTLFYFAILGSNSFVLPQMVGPRFSHKGLDVSLRVRRVAKQVPTDRAVTLPYLPHLFHHLQEFISGFWIDSIFNQRDGRTLRRLRIDKYDWFGPMQRRRERQIVVANETKAPRRNRADEQTNRCKQERT